MYDNGISVVVFLILTVIPLTDCGDEAWERSRTKVLVSLPDNKCKVGRGLLIQQQYNHVTGIRP